MLAEIMKEAMENKDVVYFLEKGDRKYLLAFLDILGYSSKVSVKVAEDRFDDFVADIMALEENCVPGALDVVRNKVGLVSKVRTLIFSDSVCLYWEIGDYEDDEINITEEQFQELFEDVIDFICDLQYRVLHYNILFRGAFAIGRHYQCKNVTVSEALVKAHDVEGGSMKFPRVGVDITQDNEFLNNIDFLKKLVRDGRMKQDGNVFYVDYLQMFERINTWHPCNKLIEQMTLRNNRECYLNNIAFVEEKISTDEVKKIAILDKYRWLKEYHNQKCKELRYPELTIE